MAARDPIGRPVRLAPPPARLEGTLGVHPVETRERLGSIPRRATRGFRCFAVSGIHRKAEGLLAPGSSAPAALAQRIEHQATNLGVGVRFSRAVLGCPAGSGDRKVVILLVPGSSECQWVALTPVTRRPLWGRREKQGRHGRRVVRRPHAPITQLAEFSALNRGVPGSNPGGSTDLQGRYRMLGSSSATAFGSSVTDDQGIRWKETS